MKDPYARNLGIATGSLLASSATLLCCVLPAVLVSLGAGAAVVGLVTAVPQLIWLSEHKVAVFSLAALFLLISGAVLWRARTLPCPADPRLARSCQRLRTISNVLYITSACVFVLGMAFAFLLPRLAA